MPQDQYAQNQYAQNHSPWFALMIGNSRLHWGYFIGSNLNQTWDTPHLSVDATAALIANHLNFKDCPDLLQTVPNLIGADAQPVSQPPLWLASVVPSQTILWQTYPKTHAITLQHIPLDGLYPTLGIDRALALCGAVDTVGVPVLVVDAGTALTFSGIDANRRFVGGAILPGLGLQLRSLSHQTAALPPVNAHFDTSLPRWATTTPDSILSGVIHTLLAGLRDFIIHWQQHHPDSTIVFTGGDSSLLLQYFQHYSPELAASIHLDPTLIFWGIRAVAV